MTNFSVFLKRPVAFHPIFARIAGGATEGLFLSQAYYWSQRTKDRDGWFYKTAEEWTKEICLTRREQETARQSLRKLGVLEEERRGITRKLYYRLNTRKLSELVGRNFSTDVPEFEDATNDDSLCNNRQSELSEVTVNLYTETTTETTSLSTQEEKEDFDSTKSDRLPIPQPLANQPEDTQPTNQPIMKTNVLPPLKRVKAENSCQEEEYQELVKSLAKRWIEQDYKIQYAQMPKEEAMIRAIANVEINFRNRPENFLIRLKEMRELKALYQQRSPLFEKFANFVIDQHQMLLDEYQRSGLQKFVADVSWHRDWLDFAKTNFPQWNISLC